MPTEVESTTPPSTSSTSATVFSCNVFLPPKLDMRCGNLSKEWKQWRQVWDGYEDVTDLRNKTSRFRVATFITCIGKEALKVHNGLLFQNDEQKADINKLKYWSCGKITASKKETLSMKDTSLTTARRNNQIRSILTPMHSERLPKLASLEPLSIILSATELFVVFVTMA